MKFSPRPYQTEAIDFLIDHPVDLKTVYGTALWLPMGCGKSVSTLTALDRLSLVEDIYPILIIAPLRVAASTWPDEVRKWDHLKRLKVVSLTGPAKNRTGAIHRPFDIHTVNPENIAWLRETWGAAWPYKTVVVDESTMLKGFRTRQGGKRTRELALALRDHPARMVELTGTPAPNGVADLWGQAWYLDHGAALGKTHGAFVERWFKPDWSGYGVLPLPHAQPEIQAAMSHLCMSIDPAEHFDLEAPVVVPVYVDLPPKAREQYDEMETAMFVEIEAGEVEVFAAAARTSKCQQIANGAIYYEERGEFEVLHDAKIDALHSIVEESAGAPLLVAYQFKSDLKRIKKAFPKAVHLGDDPQTITDWNEGRIPMLLAHPQSAGHGLNLQYGGCTLVNFAHTWNLEHRLQILERIGPVRQLQAGFKRPVFVYNIIARNTVDELVLARTDAKKSVQDILMEAVKAKKK